MDELNLSPEELQALIALGIKPEQLALNREDLDDAKQMRYGAGPEGRMAGRIYMMANPLEHAANAMQRYKGKKDEGRLRTERAGLLEEITRGRGMFGDILRGKGQMSAVGTPPIAPPQVSGPQGGFPMPSMPQVLRAGPQQAGPPAPSAAPNPPVAAPPAPQAQPNPAQQAARAAVLRNQQARTAPQPPLPKNAYGAMGSTLADMVRKGYGGLAHLMVRGSS